MTSQDSEVWHILDQSEVFAQIKREKKKISLTLLLIASAYYAILLLGPTYLKVLFGHPLAGELNIGTVFAISQYPFCGLLACIYLHKMRSVDRQVASLVKQFHQGEL